MVKRAALPLAAFAAGALAQNPGTTTITYSVCPTATTTTVTLSSTITYCPGASCNVTPTSSTAGPATITTKPHWPNHGGYTSTILDWTFTGADGKVTELHEYVTVYPAPCPNGPGMCGATWTITEECPCTQHGPGHVPHDFTTTLHKCDRCGPNGDPTSYTATVPCETGAYATITPSVGPWKPHKPAGDDGDDGEDDDYWHQGGKGGKGGDPAAGGDGKPVADAHGSDGGKGGDWNKPAAGGDGKPVADAQGGDGGKGGDWNKPAAGSDGKPVADAQGGSGGSGGSGKPAGGDGKPVADAQGGSGGSGSKPSGSSPVGDYKGAGSKATVAISSVFAVAVGALALML